MIVSNFKTLLERDGSVTIRQRNIQTLPTEILRQKMITTQPS